VIAAGGDGTVNTVAGLCQEHGVVFGVIPLGTFNYFAREMGIPVTIKESVAIIAKGDRRKCSAGMIEKHLFLNNASFGLYSKLIRRREEASSSFGRWRIVAAITAAYTLFHRQKLFAIIVTDAAGTRKSYRTSMVFVGNNTLQLENLGLNAANCTRQNKLAMIIMKKNTRWETARFLIRGIMRNLRQESKLEELCSESFDVEMDRPSLNVVIDGEIVTCTPPLRFSAMQNALEVIAPPEGSGQA
jgi:diacylglycerol kinase family enzyme